MSIVKLANDFYTKHYNATNAYDNMMSTHISKTTGPYGKSALIGGGIGIAGGALAGYKKDMIPGAIVGGLGGALIGLSVASSIHHGRAHNRAAKHDKNYHKKVNALNSLNDYHYNRIRGEEHEREMVRSLYRRD